MPLRRAADRQIYCLIRPDVSPPGPLSHLQMVTRKEQLIKELIEILQRSAIEFDAVELRALAGKLERGLFGEIRQFDAGPRVHFVASAAEFVKGELPATAVIAGDDIVLGDLFSIQASTVPTSILCRPRTGSCAFNKSRARSTT